MAHERAIPSVRCSARANSTGQRCARWAIPGTTVCHFHGGKASQVKAAAAANETLATLAARDPRPPHVVMLDAVHLADSLMQESKAPLLGGEPIGAEQVTRLVEAMSLAHHLARTAISTGAYAALAREQVRRAEVDGRQIARVLAAVLDAFIEPLHGVGATAEDTTRLRHWLGPALRAALEATSAATAAGDHDSKLRLDRESLPAPPLAGLVTELLDRRVAGHPEVVLARALRPQLALGPATRRPDHEDVLAAAHAAANQPAPSAPGAP